MIQMRMRSMLVGLLLLCAPGGRALGVGLGGRGPATAGRTPTVTTAIAQGGYFDGKSYQLGYFVSPLFGYESNYKITTVEVQGSALWAIEGGAELRYHPSERITLRTEASLMVRGPLADAGLTEFLLEVPALLRYRINDRMELSLGNHLGLERSKTPPVFGISQQQLAALTGKTLRYFSVYETLRPAFAYHLSEQLFAEVGPYFRIKQIKFSDNIDEPDFRLFDIGADVALKYLLSDRFSARLRYDIARRLFTNYGARTADNGLIAGEDLAMTRQMIGVMLRGRIIGELRAHASYDLRLASDKGGFFDYVDHLVGLGLSFAWRERLTVGASISYLRRSYGKRTPCSTNAPGDPINTSNPNCTGTEPQQQTRQESAFLANLGAAFSIVDWLQVVLSYELEDASADIEDPLVANHRVMSGLTFNF